MINKMIYLLVFLFVLFSCGQEQKGKNNVIRLGYFPNLTHSQALLGVEGGLYQKILGDKIKVEPVVFNAGPALMEAIFAGKIDVAFIGPNPAINGYIKSKGEALRIIAGANSGGASLVIRKGSNIKSFTDITGKIISTPQLGNTQDIALRAYLAEKGLKTKEQGGEVTVYPLANASILDLFKQGKIDAAWVPEPWVSRLIKEAEGEILLDERTLWQGGIFPTAYVVASFDFLEKNYEMAKSFVQTHVKITDWEKENKQEASQLIEKALKKLTGKSLGVQILTQAMGRMEPTTEFMQEQLQRSFYLALKAGFIREEDSIEGIFEMDIAGKIKTGKK